MIDEMRKKKKKIYIYIYKNISNFTEGSVLSLILVERLLDEILSLVFLEVSTSGCCWFK